MATQMGSQAVERANALLSELARPTMEHLSEMSRETVNRAVPRGSQLIQIDQVDSRYLIGATNWVGMDLPAH